MHFSISHFLVCKNQKVHLINHYSRVNTMSFNFEYNTIIEKFIKSYPLFKIQLCIID